MKAGIKGFVALGWTIAFLVTLLLSACARDERKKVMDAQAVEATLNLTAIRTCQAAHKALKGVYIECRPSPLGGGTDAAPDAWEDAGGFGDIGFSPGPVRFQYAVIVGDDGASYTATALGDLDENGVQVTYTVTNTNSRPTKKPKDEH
jgi:hypothetical protein